MPENIKIAVLDLYEGEANEGMRCIRELIEAFARNSTSTVTYDVFDVRGNLEVPDLSYDAYISSGGPGSPLSSVGTEWEEKFFGLMEGIKQHNRANQDKKLVFLICHSFQIFCRHYKVAKLSKRKSTAFGVMTVHKSKAGQQERLLKQLPEPFWAIDSRDYQITEPDELAIQARGGQLLCIEKDRPLIPFERAVMAIRFSDEIVGFQFHPEADYNSMYMYLNRDDKKNYVLEKYGEKKYREMLINLNDPEKIKLTHQSIIPAFLREVEQRKLTVAAN